MLMLAPTACMVLPEQLVDETAYALKHRSTGTVSTWNGTQRKPCKDERYDEETTDERHVGKDRA